MSRLTKNISDKQTYCGYEVKDCKYQQIYGFKKYSELEDYVDCDLTLAIDKLGQLEDLEEQLGCPLEVMFEALENGIYTKESEADNKLELFEVRGIEKKGVSVISKFCGYAECDFTCEYKDYKKTWWLKEDKSE